MNLKNLFYNLLLITILTAIFATPLNVFAIDFNFFDFDKTDDYQTLSELESKRILQKFSKKLSTHWLSNGKICNFTSKGNNPLRFV